MLGYLFIILGSIYSMIIILRVRKPILRVFRKQKLTNKKLLQFYVKDKYTRESSSEGSYYLRLISEDEKHELSVLVEKEQYFNIENTDSYGQLPIYYSENNNNLYIIGTEKEMILEEAISQEIKRIVFSIITIVITILILYYSYSYVSN